MSRHAVLVYLCLLLAAPPVLAEPHSTPVQQSKQCLGFAPYHPSCGFSILITDNSDVNITMLFPTAFVGDLDLTVSQLGVAKLNVTCFVEYGGLDLALAQCAWNGVSRYTNGVPIDFQLDATSFAELPTIEPVGQFGVEAKWDY